MPTKCSGQQKFISSIRLYRILKTFDLPGEISIVLQFIIIIILLMDLLNNVVNKRPCKAAIVKICKYRVKMFGQQFTKHRLSHTWSIAIIILIRREGLGDVGAREKF